ncbi:MAG: hypothetical protein U1F06_08110 [Steroidobacteraceae bacterium]
MPQFNLASRLAAAALLLAAMPAAAVRTEQAGVIADGIEAAAPAPLGASWARYRASGALRLLDWQADGRLLVAVPAPHGMQAARIAGPLAAPELLAPADGAGAADGVAATGNVTAAAAHPFDARRVALRFDAGQGRARLAVLDPARPRSRCSRRPRAPMRRCGRTTAGAWPTRVRAKMAPATCSSPSPQPAWARTRRPAPWPPHRS